ncbi:MAG: DUF3806 domain-containing protein [Flavobacteriales bacterium]|nr:DUF3806 domain-containing protein [Flavobacteriales bacterium]
MTQRQLNKEDQLWVEQQLTVYEEMLQHYLNTSNDYGPETIDIIFEKALPEVDNKAIEAQTVASAIGCAMGEGLKRQLGFEWVIVSDNFGTDLALINHSTTWTAFPISSVWKRLESKETGFVSAIFQSFKTM